MIDDDSVDGDVDEYGDEVVVSRGSYCTYRMRALYLEPLEVVHLLPVSMCMRQGMVLYSQMVSIFLYLIVR